ncbi:MAG: hypothetical protein WC935_02625, partial [Thermoleophilia bacterium]
DLSTYSQTDAQEWSGRYYSGSDAHYTKVSPPDSQGIVTTVETWFVYNNGNVVTPPGSYNSNIAESDTPPTDLVRVRITTSWADRSGDNAYVLDSQISSTGQSPSEVGGCVHASNSHVDATGLVLTVSTGTAEPYTVLVNGKLGEAHAVADYGCTPDLRVNATGGWMSIVGGSTYTGATLSVTGPPEVDQTVGPTSVGPPATYPKPTISNSRVRGKIEDENGSMEVEAEGEAMLGTQSLQLEQVSGTPTGTLSDKYIRWDFLNPTITAIGNNGGDDGEDIEAEIVQENGNTTGKAEIHYQTINILPLQKWPTETTANPSAAQGIVFIDNFQAKAESSANGTPGGATNTLTYSFTLWMFNPNRAGCTYSSTVNTCYDPHSISQSNPIQNVALSNANYRLQNELITEWYSFTAADISNAMYASADGKNAAITVDSLVKISSKYGTEINWRTNNNAITLVSQGGLQQSWIGAIDISVEQNG